VANPYRTSIALTAAVTNGICLSQTLGAAGKLTINGSLASGGVATLTSTNCVARRVGITSAGNDSGITWTITGTNRYGVVVSETLTGANAGTANSVRDYATVTSIAGSGASASTVTAGTNTIASTEWRVLDIYREFFSVGLGFTASGTINATVEITFDDPLAAQPGSLEPTSAQPPTAIAYATLAAMTGTTVGSINFPVFACRLTVNSGTGTGVLQVIQSGTCN
jgi:hypothetical protein